MSAAELTPPAARAGEPPSSAAVDVHAHHLPLEVLRIDGRFAARDGRQGVESLYFEDRHLGPIPPRLTDVSLLVEDMERANLSHRVCCAPSWLTCYWAEPALGRELSRGINEAIAGSVKARPDRLLGLAALPLQDVEGAVAELRHGVKELGLVGASAGTNVNGVYFDDERFEPFFEAVQELDVPLFFHPNNVAGEERLKEYGLTQIVGNPYDAAISLSRVILGGVLERFPALKLCFPLGGGGISFLLGRLQHGWEVRPEARTRAPRPPAEYVRSCHFDTILHSSLGFRGLVEVMPADRLLIGSDYPWEMGEREPRRMVESSGLAPAECRAVLAGNAGRLLNTDFGAAGTGAGPLPLEKEL